MIGFRDMVAVLPHAVTNNFSATKCNLVAIAGEILLDLDDEGFVSARRMRSPRGVWVRKNRRKSGGRCSGSRSSSPKRMVPPFTRPRCPKIRRRPPKATRGACFSSPGSNRMPVPGGNVQMHAERASAIELQRRIHLEKMIVASHLNGTVAGVPNQNRHLPAPLVGGDRVRTQAGTRLES